MAFIIFPLDKTPEYKAYLEQHGCRIRSTTTVRGTPVDEITFPEGTTVTFDRGALEPTYKYVFPNNEDYIYVTFLKRYEGQAVLSWPAEAHQRLFGSAKTIEPDT